MKVHTILWHETQYGDKAINDWFAANEAKIINIISVKSFGYNNRGKYSGTNNYTQILYTEIKDNNEKLTKLLS